MSKVLVLAGDGSVVEELRPHLGEHELLTPSAQAGAGTPLPDCDLVLLDESFSADHGLDFLKRTADRPDVPVVFLVPPDAASFASEALTLGAFNFLVKVREYTALLDCVVRTTLRRTAERREMLESLEQLRKKIEALAPAAAAQVDAATPATASRRRVIEEIATRLRSGEINLPAQSQLETELSAAIDRGVGIEEICAIVSRDVTIAAELMRLANSSYFRGARPIGSLADAIGRLGIAATQRHVNVVCNRALYSTADDVLAPRLLRLWRHGAAVAHVSRLVAGTTGADANEAFTAGLLHDIGHLLLLQVGTELARSGGEDLTLEPAALEALIAASHPEFGSVLLKRWRMPETISTAIALHHGGRECESPLAKVIQFADRLAIELGFDYGTGTDQTIPLAEAGAALGLTTEAIEGLRTEAQSLLSSIDTDPASS